MSSSANRPRRSGKQRILIRGCIVTAISLLILLVLFKPDRKFKITGSPLEKEHLSPPSFTHKIRPILATNCYSCHGGAEATPPRLDTKKVGTIFEALHRKNGGLGLPDDETHQNILTLRESSLLQRWRVDGAQHESHWAFQPLPHKLVAPEKFGKSPWTKGKIDQFHLSHLARKHRRPSPRADTLTLLRRISIDLNGEPPSPALLEESLTWKKEDHEKHYHALIDEMIANSKFGETLADMWFDVLDLRHNSHKEDHSAPFSLWQDWVTTSFNSNRPIDEFIRLQIAGDQINKNPSALATAIFRTPLRQPEKGLTPNQQLAHNLDDRLYRLSKGFLGFPLFNSGTGKATLNPVTNDDLQILRTLFRLLDESGAFPPGHPPGAPTIILRSQTAENEIAQTKATLELLDNQLETNKETEHEELKNWLNSLPRIPIIPDLVAAFHCDTPGEELTNQALGEKTARGSAPKVLVAPGVLLNALVLGGGAHADFHELCPTSPNQAWTLSAWIRLLDLDREKTILFERTPQDHHPGRFFLEYENGILRAGWERDGSAQSLIVTAAISFDEARDWAHLTWICDGSGKAAGLQLYRNGKPLPQEILADSLPTPIFHPEDSTPLRAGSTSPRYGSFLLDEFHAHRRALTPLEITHLVDQKKLFKAFANPENHTRELTDYYFSSISEKQRALRAQRKVKRKLLATLQANPVELPVLQRPQKLDLENTPTLFSKLFPPDSTQKIKSPLDFAQWMTSPSHPLTARVFVNHVWTHFFGEGLAPTSFGLEGEAVKQHHLLDWLAHDFVENGWNLKRLCRQIVLSNTYQQSRSAPPLLAPHQQLGVMLHITALTEAEKEKVRTLFHQPPLHHDWTLARTPEQAPIPEEFLIKTARHITKELLLRAPDDRTIMRELFLRFRGQDETHPEFDIVMGLFELQKKNLSENDDTAPKLILSGGARDETPTDLDPVEWAAWIETCTALLNDQGIRRQR